MGLSDIFKSKKNKSTQAVAVIEESSCAVANVEGGLKVVLEQLPTTYKLDESSLIEITDKGILSRIDTLIPSASTAGVSISNIANNLKGDKGETLYKVILEKGAKLVDSKKTPGAKRGLSRNGKHINEVADLIPVVQAKDNALIVSNVGAAVMNTASMVVGQYYMHQVDVRLSAIKDSLSRVNEYLDIQYRSRVASLIESVFNVTKYEFSSIENDDLRRQEIDKIQDYREKCQELLYEAETHLEILTENNGADSYEAYEKKIGEIEYWSRYQNILVKLLYQIDMLDFTLQLGVKSKEQCFGSFHTHTDKVESIHKRLVKWHKIESKTLKINLDEGRRKHTGVLALLEKPLSKINDDWNYKTIGKETLKTIKSQTAELLPISYTDDNLFDKDVTIIAKDGKYFYLP